MYFAYSWISNFLNDLLKATLSIGGYIEGMNKEKFIAYWEPAIDDWLLYTEENNLIIQINCYEDETRKKQIETTKIQCDYIEFVKALFDRMHFVFYAHVHLRGLQKPHFMGFFSAFMSVRWCTCSDGWTIIGNKSNIFTQDFGVTFGVKSGVGFRVKILVFL